MTKMIKHNNNFWEIENKVMRKYDEEYFEKYKKYSNNQISHRITAQRRNILIRYESKMSLDFGIGSGTCIERNCKMMFGYDINPYSVDWLLRRGLYVDYYNSDLSMFDSFTFWDSLEHVENIELVLNRITKNAKVYISIPIIDDLKNLETWKHYRENEHFYYFTRKGFLDFMKDNKFHYIECNNFEILAGRQDIYTYVFSK